MLLKINTYYYHFLKGRGGGGGVTHLKNILGFLFWNKHKSESGKSFNPTSETQKKRSSKNEMNRGSKVVHVR